MFNSATLLLFMFTVLILDKKQGKGIAVPVGIPDCPSLGMSAASESYDLCLEKGLVSDRHSVYIEVMNVIQYFFWPSVPVLSLALGCSFTSTPHSTLDPLPALFLA